MSEEKHEVALREKLETYNEAFLEFIKKGRETNPPSITVQNLGNLLREEIGTDASIPELRDMIAAYDLSRNGALGFQEFVTMMNNNDEEIQEPEFDEATFFTRATIHETFSAIDIDGDGCISFDDIRRAVQEHCPGEISEAELHAIIQVADTQKGEKMSYQHFVDILTNEDD